MPVTAIYSLPYQALSDPPDGAGLGEDLSLAVEAELVRIDAAVVGYLPAANIATGSVLITPVANTPTSDTVTWTGGKSLPGTVRAWATAQTTVPNTVLEVTVSGISATGCTATIYRTNTTATTVHVIAIGGL
jgi:hypothetical protein